MPYDKNRRRLFATSLKAARRRAGLTSDAAAALICSHGIPCTRGTLLAWERGHGATSREPFASDLFIIACIYQCTVDALVCSVGIQDPETQIAETESAVKSYERQHTRSAHAGANSR